MSRPADELEWQRQAACARPENKTMIDYFFSKEFNKKYAAKNLCFSCPVRAQCLKWALEHKQIWGVWGGKDEVEIRRALSVGYTGEETRRRRFPNCPLCSARPVNLFTGVIQLSGGGRWTTAKIVTCKSCNFSWKSRTSANAVEAYHLDRQSRLEKAERAKARRKNRAKRAKPPRKKPCS